MDANPDKILSSDSLTSRWPEVIVITGPTASGKSALAIEVATELKAHIISADSRQIYRGMPITTAVPTLEERSRVPHHLIEFLDPSDYYSAAAFRSDAMHLIEEAARRGDKYVVVCGGSMMYIDALLYGLDELPTVSAQVRERVKNMYADLGLEGLCAYLGYLSPGYEESVDVENPRRVMHALELCLQSGCTLQQLMNESESCCAPFSFRKYALLWTREELFARINRRVEEMLAVGMEDEARKHYPRRHLNSLNTIGFKEWFAFFEGKMSRSDTVSRIAKNTRVYAKKQLTWLGRRNDTVFLRPSMALRAIVSTYS